MMSSNHNSLMGLPPNSSGSHGMLNNNSLGMPPGLSPMLPSSSLNPAMNDSPLEFNTNKNRPPVAISSPNNNNAEISIIDETIVIEDTKRDRSSLRSGRARSREKDRERNRGKDRLRERNSRERERARSNDRARKENDLMRTNSRPNMNPDNHNSPSNGDGMPQPPSMPDPPPPPPGQSGGFGPINPWAPMWGPMGNPMGPMPPPMGGPMPGPVGPMGPIGPMGPMGPMGGPMGPPSNEPPPLTGDFRISWGMFGWVMSPEGSTVPVKNSLHCKTCVLIPPNQRALPPTTRDRPSGCRTVFVGGLPENVSEEVVRDVFERAGEITTIRLSKKNFCHIRYELEDFVDNAIFLSGYRMRINNSSESANSGRLHVDYAQARDDQYEFECRQRQLQREQRHRERMEAERLRPPSPPPVVHFSEHESSAISEQLKGEETFSRAAQILITWLERGDCTKRNAGIIYSMIQSTNSHVRRLMSEKEQYEEELEKFKEQTRARIQGVLMQFGQIERVFASAGHQKVWDHFTKAQRRNIEIWKKQAEEIKSVQLDESDRDDTEEMDVSDDDESNVGFSSFGKKKKTIQDSLKEENDSLRCQMEAYKNEVDLVKADLRSEMSVKDDQIQALKKTLQGMQQTLTDNAAKKRQDETKYGELKQKMKLAMDKYGFSEEDSSLDDVTTPPTLLVSEKSALLIGLISTFLHIHPKGASVDYIWSYIQQFEKEIRPSDIESLLNQYATVFKQISTGVGACLERKWTFIGFKQD